MPGMIRKRGLRRIVSAHRRDDGGFDWLFDCGHSEIRPYANTYSRPRAVCQQCRRTTPGRPEDAPPDAVAASKRLRSWRRAKGICTQCTAPVEPGKAMCQAHLDRVNRYQREAYARRRATQQTSETKETK